VSVNSVNIVHSVNKVVNPHKDNYHYVGGVPHIYIYITQFLKFPAASSLLGVHIVIEDYTEILYTIHKRIILPIQCKKRLGQSNPIHSSSSSSYIATNGQSVSSSWSRAP
jgi:hypothetical protein